MKLLEEKLELKDSQGFTTDFKTQVTYAKRAEVCGLCGELETINELGEFVSPCSNKRDEANAQS